MATWIKGVRICQVCNKPMEGCQCNGAAEKLQDDLNRLRAAVSLAKKYFDAMAEESAYAGLLKE